jgi:hypothetical protein
MPIERGVSARLLGMDRLKRGHPWPVQRCRAIEQSRKIRCQIPIVRLPPFAASPYRAERRLPWNVATIQVSETLGYLL